MTQAIADFKTLSDVDFVEWNQLESPWQERITGAIAPGGAGLDPIATRPPSALVYPHTPEALSAALKLAHQQRLAILPCGGGSKLNWGGLVQEAQLAISTQRLNRIVEHAVGDLTVTVEAGVKLRDLQDVLKSKQQFLPLDPAYPDEATMGGIVATADTGSWRQRYGGVRDMVLGLTFVRADGQMAKAGGRVVKNVAGYDLMKLFTGSYGTLGVISQITFRVYPLPDASTTVLLTGEAEAIATAAQTLRNSSLTPTAADLLSASRVQQLELGQHMGLRVRFQSIPESVQEQATQLKAIAQELGLTREEVDEAQLWQPIKSPSAIRCKIGVIPSAAVAVLRESATLTAGQGFGLMHNGSGLGTLYLDELEIVKKMRAIAQNYQGFLTVLEASTALKQQLEPWGYTGNALTVMRKLKQQFDPKNILSPGRFVGGI
ncbi:MAG: FAD-binding oxidoreductase [Cyanophyceae cyanobacterium]